MAAKKTPDLSCAEIGNRRWKLDSGRIAKKPTEGLRWTWAGETAWEVEKLVVEVGP